MRRRRRRIQYYNAEPTRERLRDKPWMPFLLVGAGALVIAVIVGAILGGIAGRTHRDGITYGDLAELGGVEAPEKTYLDLYPIDAAFVSHRGMDRKSFLHAVRDLPRGNAVGVWLYDGRGGVYFQSSLVNKTEEDLTIQAPLTVSELAEVVKDEDRYGVGYFVVGALGEADEQRRILAVAHEMALLSEIAASGLSEVVLVGLPCDADTILEVSRYVRQADEILGRTILGVALAADGDVARLVGATEASADSYFLDVRTLTGDALKSAITQNAYYLTYYNMRVLLNEAKGEEAAAVKSGFGLTACQLMPATQP